MGGITMYKRLRLSCSLSREKVSISLDKDENSLRALHMRLRLPALWATIADLNPIFECRTLNVVTQRSFRWV